MIKWEYREIEAVRTRGRRLRQMRDTHGEDLDLTESKRGILTAAWARLQEAGQDGWELVSATEAKDRDTLDEERRYILKRPIGEGT